MNLVQMINKFITRANDLANELSGTEIQEYLNRAYQFAIPNDIGGAFNETIWNLQTTAGDDEYDVPDYISSPADTLSGWINSYLLNSVVTDTSEYHIHVSTDPDWFQYWIRYGDASATAIPSAALIYGRTVTLNRVPDLAYIIKFPSRGGPQSVLQTVGLTNDAHANAVVFSAVAEYLDDVEDELGNAKALRDYELWRRRLKLYAQGTPNSRHKARSF